MFTKKLLYFFGTCFFLSCVSPLPVFAAFSLSITAINPTSISSPEQEVTININISDLPSESYFRIAWQESPGKAYFGYMKNNNGDWVKVESSQDCKNYYKISDVTTTSLVLITKVGEENPIQNGTYLLKARRYTASCSSYTDSDSFSVEVNFPVPTSTPTPTILPSNTPTPTKTPTPPPTAKPSATTKPVTPTTSPSSVSSVVKQSVTPTKKQDVNAPTAILGENTSEISPSPSKTQEEVLVKGESRNNFIGVIAGVGVVFVLISGILAFRNYTRNKRDMLEL